MDQAQPVGRIDVISDGEWWRKSYIGVIAEPSAKWIHSR